MMGGIESVLERADVVLCSKDNIERIELPALREVMEHIASIKNSKFAYTRHTAHSKTSTRGCVMGCLGG